MRMPGLADSSDLLARLSGELQPLSGVERSARALSDRPQIHSRYVRLIPKSRDFH
ncbi:hypothetical protein [Paracoccus sp. 22332]|uniref:hypothetical protein n=1 Tax=Paracoccus sp. 22332 TaxID=3453913 RepID=UPI003F84AEE5